MTIGLYIVTAVLLCLSLAKSREKTARALKKAWSSFEGILPQLINIMLMMGFALAVLNKSTISKFLGPESGLVGMSIAAVVGSIILIPAFIAFPMAASIMEAGAGYGQTAMFLTTLMMVGVVTIPLESMYFGMRLTIWRNSLAFVYAFIASLIMGAIL